MQIPASFSAKQRALVERLSGAGRSASTSVIPRSPLGGPVQLSFAQQRLWVLEQLTPGTPLYNVPCVLRLHGPLDYASLDRAMLEILRRHEALRTIFPEAEGSPAPQITAVPPSALEIRDLSLKPQDERSTAVAEMLGNQAARPFQLAQGPLVRPLLLRLEPESHILAVTMHHIVCDAWSMPVLLGELSLLYEAFMSGRRHVLAELPVQYSDYAAWQRCRLSGDVFDRDLRYWRECLEGTSGVLELPLDRPRPRSAGWAGNAVPFALDA